MCDACILRALLQAQRQIKTFVQLSPAFVGGITGSVLKKDIVVKHSKSDMHTRAVNMSRKLKTRNDIFRATPIGRALAGASGTKMARVSKLIDLAYVIAKEELPFTKYEAMKKLMTDLSTFDKKFN